MKKILLGTFLVIASIAANAQNFTFQHDTLSMSTSGTPGINADAEAILMENYIFNSSADTLFDLSYRIIDVNLPFAWSLYAFCDNIECHPLGWVNTHLSSTQVAVMYRVPPGDSALLEPRLYIPQNADNGIGIVKVKVTSGTQVDTAVYIMTKTALGVHTIALNDSRVSVYPNPSIDKFTVFVNKELNAKNVVVFNILGAEVARMPVNSEIVNFNSATFATGNYMVKVLGANNEIITTRQWTKR